MPEMRMRVEQILVSSFIEDHGPSGARALPNPFLDSFSWSTLEQIGRTRTAQKALCREENFRVVRVLGLPESAWQDAGILLRVFFFFFFLGGDFEQISDWSFFI